MSAKLLPGVDALSVSCPYCGMPKGHMCRLSTNYWDVPKPHVARVKLANDRKRPVDRHWRAARDD
jgi:hypothetical protein